MGAVGTGQGCSSCLLTSCSVVQVRRRARLWCQTHSVGSTLILNVSVRVLAQLCTFVRALELLLVGRVSAENCCRFTKIAARRASAFQSPSHRPACFRVPRADVSGLSRAGSETFLPQAEAGIALQTGTGSRAGHRRRLRRRCAPRPPQVVPDDTPLPRGARFVGPAVALCAQTGSHP